MMNKKKRIEELELELGYALSDLKLAKEDLALANDELVSVKRKWEATTKENVELRKTLDEIHDGVFGLPEGCKTSTLCAVCGHHKRIHSRLLGYLIDVCDITNSCSKFAPMDCVEVKND